MAVPWTYVLANIAAKYVVAICSRELFRYVPRFDMEVGDASRRRPSWYGAISGAGWHASIHLVHDPQRSGGISA